MVKKQIEQLIKRNTTIPTTKSQVFSTAVDSQPEVTIHVVQGERSMVADNKSLGRFNLEGIEPAPRGVPQIEVSFSIDTNGILKVTAKDKKTEKEQSITIENNTSLSEDEINKMVEEAEKNREEDQKKKEEVEVKVSAESIVNQMEKGLNESGDKVDAKQKEETEKDIKEWKDLLEKNDIEGLKKKVEDFNKMAQQFAQAAAAGQQPQGDGPIEGNVKEKESTDSKKDKKDKKDKK